MDADRFPTLDPDLVDLVRMLPDDLAGLDDVPASRAMIKTLIPVTEPEAADRLEITDVAVGDASVRVYRPRDVAGDLPGLLYIHGGGFCLGDVETEHLAAAWLADELGVVLASVDYRLAPEHTYPAGLDDCYAALEHLAKTDGVDDTRIAVHGQSAGGALAAGVALLARDRGGPAVCFQSLGIPVLDDRLDSPSMRAFVDTPLWSRPQAEKSWELYLGGREADGYAAPARTDDLAGLPPAYVVTCELDPLRDEGLIYAMRLLQAGVSVELHQFPGTFHGASLVPGAAVVKRMTDELVTVLRRALFGRR